MYKGFRAGEVLLKDLTINLTINIPSTSPSWLGVWLGVCDRPHHRESPMYRAIEGIFGEVVRMIRAISLSRNLRQSDNEDENDNENK